VVERRVVIPGLATWDWVQERRRVWFPYQEHPLYAVRVGGNFPTQATNAVISLAAVSAALARWEPMTIPEAARLGRLRVGVDVARFGDDDTVIAGIRGERAFPLVVTQKGDGGQIAMTVVRQIAVWRQDPAEVVEVNVDLIGVGASVFDFLALMAEDHRILVRGINVAHTAQLVGQDGVATIRDVLWFGGADWLQHYGAIPPDPRLEAELVAPTFRFELASGKARVERKEEMKDRLKRSPDRADALLLAIFRPPVVGQPVVRQLKGEISVV
jgi:hypothetical protein